MHGNWKTDYIYVGGFFLKISVLKHSRTFLFLNLKILIFCAAFFNFYALALVWYKVGSETFGMSPNEVVAGMRKLALHT